jgi:hypothetical protein
MKFTITSVKAAPPPTGKSHGMSAFGGKSDVVATHGNVA